MITAITLENFKVIGNKVRIELKPLTLIFGANSAGKSTIIQAIHYAREILERGNTDPDKTLFGGDVIDLGGFKNLVHKRQLNNPIVMRFDLDLSDLDLPTYENYSSESSLLDLSNKVKTAWVQLTVKFDYKTHKPFLASYETGINERIVGEMSTDNFSKPYLKHDQFHPLFEIQEVLLDEIRSENWVTNEIAHLTVALPSWGKRLDIIIKEEDKDIFYYYNQESYTTILSQLLVGTGQILKDILYHFCYLGPLREIPQRNYQPTQVHDVHSLHSWSNGIAAWNLLYQDQHSLVEKVSKWVSKLGTGYRLQLKSYKELDVNLESHLKSILTEKQLSNNPTFNEVKLQLQTLPTYKRLLLIEENTFLEVLPQDVGVGISQLIPVVVAALDETINAQIVVIEQPELHVHPAIQAKLGDLFITQANKKGTVFLLETHSEHLILRLLRRIRETTGSRISDDNLGLSPDMVSVIYVESTSEGIKLTQLPIDETGEFIDQWPKGFFEERAEELFS